MHTPALQRVYTLGEIIFHSSWMLTLSMLDDREVVRLATFVDGLVAAAVVKKSSSLSSRLLSGSDRYMQRLSKAESVDGSSVVAAASEAIGTLTICPPTRLGM